jgi:hypothetical protein
MKLLRLWPIAASLMLFGCASTPPPVAPSVIPPPPVALTANCPAPRPLPESATARDLADLAAAWIRTAGCERAMRRALIDSWPR